MTGLPPLADAHALQPDEVARRLGVDPATGLGSVEVERRAAAAGPNALEVTHARPIWRLFAKAVTEPFVVLLLIAGVLAIALGEVRDGVLVLLALAPIAAAFRATPLDALDWTFVAVVAVLPAILAEVVRTLRPGIRWVA